MNVSVEGPIHVFHGSAEEEARQVVASEKLNSTDYFRRREAAERAAAKASKSILACRIHQQLAQAYASAASRKA